MSHIVTIQTKVRDPRAVAAACIRLSLTQPVEGTAKPFSGAATGLLLQLPDWKYPAVLNLASGDVTFDNFNGSWGDQGHLDAFLQAYACEAAKLEAQRLGHTCTESVLQDGTIKLTVTESF